MNRRWPPLLLLAAAVLAAAGSRPHPLLAELELRPWERGRGPGGAGPTGGLSLPAAPPPDVLTINASNYEFEVARSTLPVLLEYTAPGRGSFRWDWILEVLASSNRGRRKVGRIDIEAQPALARRAGVTGEHGLPVFYFFRDGRACKVRLVFDLDRRGMITGVRFVPADPDALF